MPPKCPCPTWTDNCGNGAALNKLMRTRFLSSAVLMELASHLQKAQARSKRRRQLSSEWGHQPVQLPHPSASLTQPACAGGCHLRLSRWADRQRSTSRPSRTALWTWRGKRSSGRGNQRTAYARISCRREPCFQGTLTLLLSAWSCSLRPHTLFLTTSTVCLIPHIQVGSISVYALQHMLLVFGH